MMTETDLREKLNNEAILTARAHVRVVRGAEGQDLRHRKEATLWTLAQVLTDEDAVDSYELLATTLSYAAAKLQGQGETRAASQARYYAEHFAIEGEAAERRIGGSAHDCSDDGNHDGPVLDFGARSYCKRHAILRGIY